MNKKTKTILILVFLGFITLLGVYIYKKINTVTTYEDCIKTSYFGGVNKDIREIEQSCRVIFPTLLRLSKKENTNLDCVDINQEKRIYKIRIESNGLTLDKQPFTIKTWNGEMVSFERDSEENETKRKVHMNGSIFNNGVGEITVEYLDKKDVDIHYRFTCVEN
jgi:hypothetical protein